MNVKEILIRALFSCDNEDSCAHKITVYVKYTETSEAAPIRAQFPGHVITLDQSEAVPLVEGCVDSEGEGEAPVITCDNDTITICDTRPAPAIERFKIEQNQCQ